MVRLNQAPIEPPTPIGATVNPDKGMWRRHVGTKTTFRLVNTRWTTKYGDKKFLIGGPWHEDLPLEPGVTLGEFLIPARRPSQR